MRLREPEPADIHGVKQLEAREDDMTLNYRLCFCTMSMGPLTARGDPQTLPLLPLTLRSVERQTPQLAGTLISLFESTFSLSLTLLFSAVPPRFLCGSLSACGRSHPRETWPPASCSVRLPTPSRQFSLPLLAGAGALPPPAPGRGNLGIHSARCLKFPFQIWIKA